MPPISKTLTAMIPPNSTSKKRSGLLGLLKKLKGKVTRENRANDKSERSGSRDQYAPVSRNQGTKNNALPIHQALTPPASKAPSVGPLLSSGENLFHGIGFNPVRFVSILSSGVLSQQEAARQGVSLSLNNPGGYNGNGHVSLSEYQGEHGSFRVYSREGLSFVVDRSAVSTQKCFTSGFPDEFLAYRFVPVNSLKGIMVPKEKLDKPFEALNIGITHGGTGNLSQRVDEYIAELKRHFNYAASSDTAQRAVETYLNLDLIEQIAGSKGKEATAAIESAVAKLTANAMRYHFGKNATLRNVIDHFNKDDLPLYDSEGFKLA